MNRHPILNSAARKWYERSCLLAASAFIGLIAYYPGAAGVRVLRGLANEGRESSLAKFLGMGLVGVLCLTWAAVLGLLVVIRFREQWNDARMK